VLFISSSPTTIEIKRSWCRASATVKFGRFATVVSRSYSRGLGTTGIILPNCSMSMDKFLVVEVVVVVFDL
jgi:hypothetical protein